MQPGPLFTSTVHDIQICSISFGSIRELKEYLLTRYPRVVVIVDEKVLQIYHSTLKSIFDMNGIELLCMIPVAEGESCKQVNEFLRVIELLQNLPINRRDTIVVIGGGACCDMGGVVAATFMRGIPYVLIPTTLMAMVDAAYGGKVALNLSKGKNLLGGFHTPKAVWVDTAFLGTLPKREIRQALGEVLKIAIISNDPEFFEKFEAISKQGEMLAHSPQCLDYLIEYSAKKKLYLVEKDWKEKNLDRLLNAGHEIAHSLEKVFEFDRSILAHGEAVALGISASTRFSKAKGFINDDDASRIIGLIERLGLPPSIKLSTIEYKKAIDAINIQKRVRHGDLRLVLPEKTFKSFIYHSEDAMDVLRYLNTE
jgi:3-dehydroquinate synthase